MLGHWLLWLVGVGAFWGCRYGMDEHAVGFTFNTVWASHFVGLAC